MRLRPGLSLIALALLPLLPTVALAQTEVSSTAVLGLEPIDAPTDLTDEISEQLRQRVSSSKDMRLVSGKDLVEVKLVFSCADEAASCMAQAGKSLDAQKLIYGSVKRTGDDYAVWLKMFDVRKARIDFWLTETLTKQNSDAASIKAVAGRWFAKLTGKPLNTGTIQVSANLPGAAVALDGVAVGVTGDRPLILGDVAPGKHEVALTRAGRTPAKQQVTVVAGQTMPLHLSLDVAESPRPVASAPEPVGPPPEKPWAPGGAGVGKDTETRKGGEHQGAGYRTGFWVTLAAGVLSVAGAVKFGLDVKDANSSLDPYRRYDCKAPNQGLKCDATGTMVRPMLTTDEMNKVSSLTDDGNRAQTLQWICIGLGSALGVASGYLLYKGYVDSEDDHATRQAHRGLRIFPSASASRGGILAEFDF